MKSLIHVFARCYTCGLEWGDRTTGPADAKAHYKATGHDVVIEYAYSERLKR